MSLLLRVKQSLSGMMASEKGATVIVAVSGGPDSVALLHILHRLIPFFAFKLVVAHVNHALRAVEADVDEQFVCQLAAQLGHEFAAERLDWQSEALQNGGNRQTLARERRYEFFARTAKRYAAQWVATAHHADDQAETLLMRSLRGTGVGGLQGIAAQRAILHECPDISLIRPLLSVTKAELLAFCAAEQLPFRIDCSNETSDYTRNALRHSVMPALGELFPQYRRALSRLAQTAAAEEEWMQALTAQSLAQLVTDDDGCRRFSRRAFMLNPIALQRRMIKLLLNYPVLDTALVERIRRAVLAEKKPNRSFALPHDLHFMRTYDKIEITCSSRKTIENYGMIEEELLDGELLQEFCEPADYAGVTDRFETWFDADQVSLPLTVRSRRPGDRLKQWGGSGSKTVKKLMIDAKVALAERATVPLVFDAGGTLLWVVGLCRSNHAPVTPQSTRLLRLAWSGRVSSKE